MIGIVEGAVGGLFVLAVNRYGPHLFKGLRHIVARLKSKLADYRYQRRGLRSVAGWNADTQAVIWLHSFFTNEYPRTRAETRRMTANAHGIPYWKLSICTQMRWSVSFFDRLPYDERRAFEEYFRSDEPGRLDAIKESWELRDEREVEEFKEYLAQRDSQDGGLEPEASN